MSDVEAPTPEFVPVDHDPYAPSEPEWLIVPQHIMSPSPLAVEIAHGVVKGFTDWVTLPARAMARQEPTVSGQWSDVDESKRQLDEQAKVNWAAATAPAMVGGPVVGAGRSLARAGASAIPRAGQALGGKGPFIFDPPPTWPRKFAKDYPPEKWPNGIPNDQGRLLVDMEGRPLTAPWVVGRAKVGGPDQVFRNDFYAQDELTKALIGREAELVPARQIRGAAGCTEYNCSGRPTRVLLAQNLRESVGARVHAHENAHVMEGLAGQISTKGLEEELRRVYNTLNNPFRSPNGKDAMAESKPFRPSMLGYKGKDIPREYMAEAIRAYPINPNYLKTVAPNTAKAIREKFNADPFLSKIIQFNSLLGAGVGLGDAARQAGIELVPIDHDPFAADAASAQ